MRKNKHEVDFQTRIDRAVHAFRMFLPTIAVLGGLGVLIGAEPSFARLIGLVLTLIGVWDIALPADSRARLGVGREVRHY